MEGNCGLMASLPGTAKSIFMLKKPIKMFSVTEMGLKVFGGWGMTMLMKLHMMLVMRVIVTDMVA